MEEFGAGSRSEVVQALPEAAFKLVGSHRPGGYAVPLSSCLPACLPRYIPEQSRTPGLPYHRGGMSEPLFDQPALPPNEQVAT
jgi:hypothetical protein